MLKTIWVLLATVLAFQIFGDKDVLSMDLNQYKWKNRLLFIFAPQEGDSFYRALQRQNSTQQAQVSERDLVVFRILETGPSFMETTRIDPKTAAAIRTKFAAPPGQFTCILVGKNGGIKLRQDSQVKLEEVFNLIDAMPMRREEMRQKVKVTNPIQPTKPNGVK